MKNYGTALPSAGDFVGTPSGPRRQPARLSLCRL